MGPYEMQQQIFMKSCTDALKNCNEESESTAFGKIVSLKHAKLNETQKMYAETLITTILNKGALNKLTEDTKILDPGPQIGNFSSETPYGSFDHQLQIQNTLSSASLSSSSPPPTPSSGSVEEHEYPHNAGQLTNFPNFLKL